MSDMFQSAVNVVLKHEGGLTDNKADPGGITNYGISLRFLHGAGLLIGDFNHDGAIDAHDIRSMDVNDAIDIYRKCWWDAYGYAVLVDQGIATKTLDTSVNLGSKHAHQCLQRAVNSMINDPTTYLTVDGVLGPRSYTLINSMPPIALLAGFRQEQAAFYTGLIEANPHLIEFQHGWSNRAAS